MITLGVDLQENEFYAPYTEECWINLAQNIMEVYATKYMCASPTTAFSQAEYDQLNEHTYAPVRRSILRQIKHGPLKNAIDMYGVYNGLERARLEYKNSRHIRWVDKSTEDLRYI